MTPRLYRFLPLLVLCAGLHPASAEPLYVSRHAAKVVPRRVLPIPADSTGEVEICHMGGRNVEAGTLLIRMNPDELEMDAAELEAQQEKNNLEAESELLKLRKEKEELDFIAGLDEKQRPFLEQRLHAQVDTRARELLERKMDAIRERCRIANEKLRFAFAKKQELHQLCMPYKGIVQYHIPLPEKVGERVAVAASTPILTIADDSVLYLAIALFDPALASLDDTKFTLKATHAGTRDLVASFAFRRMEKQGQNEQPVYYFRIDDADKEAAWALMGSNLIAELHYAADDSWLYVPKLDLVREAGASPFSTWDELVASLRPGYAIVFVGETHLCLRPLPQDNEGGPTPPAAIPGEAL